MKKLTFILLLGLLSIKTHAQEFSGISNILRKTSDEIISMENDGVNDPILNTQLRDVGLEDGGFNLHYTHFIDHGKYESSDIYGFDAKKKCIYMTTILDISKKHEQIGYLLKNGFYKKQPFKFYHKTLNLMVLVNFDDKFVSFTYQRKPIGGAF
ncbi:hypothetical protein HDE68_004986 [Pedobacter cryoconitis]|uniref:Uncharacterized protein n=1 Tax=Pedobacter cryoconitis TaxID=188932 RepID=A0A7W8ZRU7_9SPHI|nr:hypothetical protein [Pedobacter cryoconitis]MBB5639048.1 hypothetical protein [Pedobacter cryoconitis]